VLKTNGSFNRALARFVVSSRWENIPAAAKKEAVRSFLNWLGCAVGGVEHEASRYATSLAVSFSGPAATVVGTSHRVDIFRAAWINGISSHVFDFDDTHLHTVIHPSPPIAPALLALAEYQLISGEDFLHAFILGIDVACRIGNAVCPAHYNVGCIPRLPPACLARQRQLAKSLIWMKPRCVGRWV
jgi:2-methylcitrate dehydratase PrpD